MTKLWHKYALALFFAAAVPVGIATWQITNHGRSELFASAQQLQLAVSDTAMGTVRALIDGAVGEATEIGALIAQKDVDPDERMRVAQARLVGAKYLANFSIYTPTGEDIQHLVGANADTAAVGGAIVPPSPLPEVLRTEAKASVAAYSELIRRPDGALFLPITISILDAKGEVYAFAWSAVDIASFGAALGDLSERRFGRRDFVTLVDFKKRVIAADDPNRRGQPFAPEGDAAGSFDMTRNLGADMVSSFHYRNASGEERLGTVASVPDVRWGIIVEQTQAEVYAGVGRITTTALIVGGSFAALALIVGIFAARRLSAPISAVSSAAKNVAAGDFTVQVPVAGRDEVGQLGASFNAMTRQLTATIAQLQQTTAAKERMQTELDIGRSIQMSMVPLTFPAFPDRTDFDVHAALKPAFEVGGDFYDFFLTGDDTLCVCIADVSGKGVPAALFMAVTRTLVKTHAKLGASSDEILEKVNDDLAKDNDACMFVTLFLALLDLKTGVLRFTNAGHNPSYVKRKATGAIERLDKLHGPVIAAMEEIPYGSGETTLAKGDTLFLYTDGVNEAMNAKQELFTEERLAGLLQNNTWTTSDGAVKVVLDDVWKFQGAADQSDDVTVVALRYLG